MEPAELADYQQRNGKIVPLDLGDSDKLRVGDKVLGWGYPLGGERISKSEQGEISRIEVNKYAYSQDQWLMVQASLQQNRGNSGGPVLKDDVVVGISFQGMQTGDRINYFIPINLVKALLPLMDKQEQIPRWRYQIQFMFPRLKEYYNLGPDQGGILLDYIVPGGGPHEFGLRANDILVEIEGHEIDDFGEIFFQPLGQKVSFSEVINRKKVDDPLAVKVIRGGKTMEISGKVTKGLPRLVSKIFTRANYFIYGGIGFVELTLNCIDNLGKSGETFRAKYVDRFPKRPYQKISDSFGNIPGIRPGGHYPLSEKGDKDQRRGNPEYRPPVPHHPIPDQTGGAKGASRDHRKRSTACGPRTRAGTGQGNPGEVRNPVHEDTGRVLQIVVMVVRGLGAILSVGPSARNAELPSSVTPDADPGSRKWRAGTPAATKS